MNRQIAQAVTLYESFRERRPTKLARLKVRVPKVVACIGHVEAIEYRTTHGKKLTLYKHPFAAGSRPLLAVSSDGRQLLLLGGRFQFTERGIVDRDAAGQEIESPRHGKRINPRDGFKMLDLPDDGTIMAQRVAGGAWIVTRIDADGRRIGRARRFASLKGAGEHMWKVKSDLYTRINPRKEYVPPETLNAVQLLAAMQDATNTGDKALLRTLGAEQLRRDRRHHPRATPDRRKSART